MQVAQLQAQGVNGIPTGEIVGIGVQFVLNFGQPWLHVAQYRDRLYLSNGYHRCWALLRLGVTHAFAIVSEAQNLAHVGAIGPDFIAEDVLTGPKSPTLTDFNDPDLYMDYDEPLTKKIVSFTTTQYSIPIEPVAVQGQENIVEDEQRSA